MQPEISSALNTAAQPIGAPLPAWRPVLPPAHTTIAGRFCRLEPLDPARHGASLWEAYSTDTAGSLWTYLPYGPFADCDAYVSFLRDQSGRADQLFYTIIDSSLDQPVGVAAFLRIDTHNGSIEVGHLCFSPLLQKTAAATEAMYLMMKTAFEGGYRRYEWKCNSLNLPSRRAAERLGFTYEGLFRQAAVLKGRNRDTTWYSVLDSEWRQLQSAFASWLGPDNFDESGRQRTRLHELRG